MVLLVFVSVWIVGMLVRYVVGKESWLWDLWSTVDIAFAVALGLLAFMAYREMIKSEDKVGIFFKVEDRLHETGLSLLRKDCTRGEILGVLGMMQRKTDKRFLFDSHELPLLLNEVQEVQKGNKDRFVIGMTAEEFEQFDLR